ncbi:MAG: hypothetical protein NTW86_02555, partial [Candidatus Sumerlaeota bacterium]|nr:hypothetical protein [Candidatus Sumerlaeota bacterium]
KSYTRKDKMTVIRVILIAGLVNVEHVHDRIPHTLEQQKNRATRPEEQVAPEGNWPFRRTA